MIKLNDKDDKEKAKESEEPKEGIKPEKLKKKKSSIENSMSFGIDRNYEYLTKVSKYLSKNEVKAISLLIQVPYLRREVESIVLNSVHVKGWITKILLKFWTPFTKAFQTFYYDKRIQKALNRLSFGKFGGGVSDW